MFSQLGFIKLLDLLTNHTALFIFQFHHNLLAKAFDNFFSLMSSKHGIGYSARLASKSTYYIDQVRTTGNYGKLVNLINTSLVLLFGIIWMKI